MAVGIVKSAGAEVEPLERWLSGGQDVRDDVSIARAIETFLEAQEVKSVAMTDRLVGCPHEEGKDYPEGEVCPHCPFWIGRDRWEGVVPERDREN